MTRFTTMFLMALTLFSGACDDDADDAAPAEGEKTAVEGSREGAREGRRGGKFARLDADKDGAITLAEAKGSRLEGKFAELDGDRDGKLTREEMKAMKRHGGRGFDKDPGKRAEMLLGKLDADKDGALTKAEFAAKFDGERAGKFAEKFTERFAAADANADGKLTREELAAIKGGHHRGRGSDRDPGERAEMMLGKFDADKDGAISKTEMTARFAEHKAKMAEKFAEKFTAADANADGKLNREELAAMKGHHRGGRGFHKDPEQRADMVLGKLDADKDGAISKTEVDGSRFADKFARVDANGDSRVTRDELVAFRPERGERRGR